MILILCRNHDKTITGIDRTAYNAQNILDNRGNVANRTILSLNALSI